jgi:hypothetical protein
MSDFKALFSKLVQASEDKTRKTISTDNKIE